MSFSSAPPECGEMCEPGHPGAPRLPARSRKQDRILHRWPDDSLQDMSREKPFQYNIRDVNMTHSCLNRMNNSVFGMESFQRRNSIWQGSSAPTLRSTQTPVSTRRWSRRSSALTTSSPSPTTSFPSSCPSTSAAGVTSFDGSHSSASTWLVELSQPWQTSSTPSTWRSGVNGCGWPLWCRHWTWAVGSPPTSSCCTAS